ncbi:MULTISPECIES: DUF305 domain-containing protein [unclassified Streptomyces]|uniref:DUF305 domain-containing protein n=1 Tax=unclassified Streptomyces TaxID=2593676 RepID=UPI003077EF24
MIRKRSLVRRTAVVAAAGATALVLAACGGDGDGDNSAGHGGHDATTSSSAPASTSASQQGQHNAADVAFAKGMIPHHRQAIEMADIAPSRAQSAEVKKLAADIKKAQDPEIKTLSGWLTSWGEEVPAAGAMDHSMHDMGGMMTAEEMTELENASGKAFDTAFMEMMIKHHEGAVEMARTEQADGTYGPARKMAGEIIEAQSTEIEQMNDLLGKG